MPGFEKSYIVDLPPQLGIRETRRVAGGYRLSGDDVLGCAAFDDSIGVNGWPMESHVAGDVIFKFPPIPESRGFNELPYRMLVPEGVDNLLMAGRCASMTHDGQSAARVSGACFAMGEAAGTAAALALGGNTIPRDIAAEKLQLQLRAKAPLLEGIRPCRKGCRGYGSLWERSDRIARCDPGLRSIDGPEPLTPSPRERGLTFIAATSSQCVYQSV